MLIWGAKRKSFSGTERSNFQEYPIFMAFTAVGSIRLMRRFLISRQKSERYMEGDLVNKDFWCFMKLLHWTFQRAESGKNSAGRRSILKKWKTSGTNLTGLTSS